MTRHLCFITLLASAGAMAMGQSTEEGKPVGRVLSGVAAAKRQGRTEIDLPVLSVMPTVVDTLEMAAKYSVLLVEPISASVSVSVDRLTTWYTLQTDEVLIKQTADSTGNDFAPPIPLQSLAKGEILLPVGGGQATIDGTVVRDAPALGLHLRTGKKYVLVLDLQQDGRIGDLLAQADGVFEVSSDGLSVRSLRPASRLSVDVQTGWSGRLDRIRAYLKSRAASQEKF